MAKKLDLKKLLESILHRRPDSKFCDSMIITDETIKTALKDQDFEYKNDEIVSIEPESTIIKAGKWYVCDAEMINENMNVTFHRDEVYYCPKDGWIDVKGILFKVGSLCREFRPATPEETKWYITIKDFHDKDLDGAFTMPVFCKGEITTKEKVYETIQYMDDTMFSAYFRPVPTEEVLKAKHGITGIRFNKAEGELGEIIAERSICDYDHKKMLETLMQDSQRMVSAEAKEAGYDRPEQTNWTKNYDWNNGTMTIYNLSKEEHLKVVAFLDCLRHPDEPETDSGKKLPCKGCKIASAGCGLTCKKFYEYYSKIKVINVAEHTELTDFEQCLKSGTNFYVEQGRHMEDWDAKQDAKELLEIARKTILSEEIEQAYKTSDKIQYHNGMREGVDIACKWLYNRLDRQGYLDYDDLRDCKEALEKGE